MIGPTVIEGPGGGWVARFEKDHEPSDADLSLMLAAPTMYHILRVIIEGRPGLIEAAAMSEAHRLIRELEGGPDAET
jgi:hypothetical protein